MPEILDRRMEEQIAQQPLFQGLKAAQLREILETAHRCPSPRGSFFFHQGDPASTLYLLVKGRARILHRNPEGQRVLLRVITPGELFGGVALLGEATYPASAEAVEDSRALGWDGELLARLMERHPRLALNALRLLAGRLQELQERYRELATERVERRVARALLRLAHQMGRRTEEGVRIDFPLSREDLAEMTGTTLYTVSRILSGWERQGLIRAGRRRVLIRSPQGLMAIAEDLPPAPPSGGEA